MKKLAIKYLAIFLLVLFLIMLLILQPFNSSKELRATNASLDLNNWNWDENPSINLTGEWEFYWQKLYTPQDFKEDEVVIEPELITLARAWNNYQIDGEKLSGDGYATYRLVINDASKQILGIKVPRIISSYNMWVNNALIASAGQVSSNLDKMEPQYLPQVSYFKPESDTIEIIIQVANSSHYSGGILENIKLGTATEIHNLKLKSIAFDLSLFAALFVIALYHLLIFKLRGKNKLSLYLGIYSLLISIRTLLVGEMFLIHLFPNFSWELALKIHTLAYYLGMPILVLFLKASFLDLTNEAINKFIYISSSIFIAIVLLTPVKTFTTSNLIFQVLSLFVMLYAIYIIVIACLKKEKNSYLIGFGFIILFLTTINDILYHNIILANLDSHFLKNLIIRANLSSLGLLVFAFTQAIVLAKEFSQNFSQVKTLSKKLEAANLNLEEKITERTLALENSKQELNETYQAISESEKFLKNLIQNISHDLRTPLSAIKGYSNAILDGIIKRPQEQKKYLNRIIEKVNYLNQMVEELLNSSQRQAKQLKLKPTRISVRLLIESVIEKYSFDMKYKEVVFNVYYPSEWEKSSELDLLYLRVDIGKLERVFTNLLNNALTHTTDNDEIALSFSFTEAKEELVIKVSDTGTGISKSELPHIFERFYRGKKSKENSNSSGLGLAIVKEIIEYHNGRIWAESELEQGSNFYFTLPIYLN